MSKKKIIRLRESEMIDLIEKIVKEVKTTKTKIQIAIQGNELRVSGKKRDDLQSIITFCKELKGVEQPLQFINFRD